MDPKDTGIAYDQITWRWTRDDFNMENGIAQHQRALKFSRNGTPQYALDVGCGCTGRFINLLTEANFEVEGIDVSAEMIRLAKQKQPHIQFHHHDIITWTPPRQYDFITAWDSIWHLPLEQQGPVMRKLVEYLSVGGILIFSFGGVEEAGEHQNSAMGPQVHYSSLGTCGFVTLMISLGCKIRHLEFDQYPELHTYLIVEKAHDRPEN